MRFPREPLVQNSPDWLAVRGLLKIVDNSIKEEVRRR